MTKNRGTANMGELNILETVRLLKEPVEGFDWVEGVRSILSALGSDETQLREYLNGVIPDSTLDQVLHEIKSRLGNFDSTAYIAKSPVMTTIKSYELVTISKNRKFLIAQKLISRGHIEPLYVQNYLETAEDQVHRQDIEKMALYVNLEIGLREKLSTFVFEHKLDKQYIQRSDLIGIPNLTEIERAYYLATTKRNVRWEKVLELNQHFPINDFEVVAWALSGLFKVDQIAALAQYKKLVEKLSVDDRKKAETKFVFYASDAELVKINAEVRLKTTTSLLRIAELLFRKGKKDWAKEFFQRAVNEESPHAAKKLLDNYPEFSENFELLELAHNLTADLKRRYAVELIKLGLSLIHI